MDIYLLLYLLFIVAPLSTFLHEIGHAFAARTVKADHISLSVGSGNLIKTIYLEKLKINIHIIYFLGGLAKSQRKIPYKNLEIAWVTIAGPIINGIAAFLVFYLYTMFPNNYLQLLFLFNCWIAIINILPFKIKGKQTDGYTILQVITQKESVL
ncbi:site-2 protease family protein [Virgibacillus sp. C22-A2]|uniref:Site-2 protease family protein n=1 Tax=Virgibacillus tibetensis TaxID=3042313 RepID=A0ABU6KB34_9BACI|nr:site-2 protease family protein [Virgibacillus sp. C22-A2]